MRKVLFVHHSCEFYGSDKILYDVVTRLDKKRFACIVLLPSRGLLFDKLRRAGIDVRTINVSPLSRRVLTLRGAASFLPNALASVAQLLRFIRREAIDLVYSNSLAVLTPSLAAKLARVGHVWHAHEIVSHEGYIARVYSFLMLRFAEKVICNSLATKASLVNAEPRLSGKCVVVLNGIPPLKEVDATAVMQWKSALPFAEKPEFLFGLVGRVNGKKGHSQAINALGQVRQRLPNMHICLAIVGGEAPTSPDELSRLKVLIRSLSLDSCVVLLPYVEEIGIVWSAIDVALVPSAIPESFGLVAVEAMASGKAVIASDIGGLSEVIADGVNGLLVPPGDECALAEAMMKLVVDKSLSSSLGMKGRERSQTLFNADRMAQEVSDVLI